MRNSTLITFAVVREKRAPQPARQAPVSLTAVIATNDVEEELFEGDTLGGQGIEARTAGNDSLRNLRQHILTGDFQFDYAGRCLMWRLSISAEHTQ
jgi:hypothetical protein